MGFAYAQELSGAAHQYDSLSHPAAGALPEVKSLRTFAPADRVAARLEISTGGWLRGGADAGVDVMGDGTLVAFAGGIGRKPLEPTGKETAFDAVRRALEA